MWKATHSTGAVGDGVGRSNLEAEPVTDIARRGFAEIGLGDVPRRRAIHIDVNGRAHADVASQQSRCPFHDPPVVDEVETFEESVVCNLALELRQRPPVGLRFGFESFGEGSAEGPGAAIRARAVGHGVRPSPTATGSSSRREDAPRSTCARASSIHRGVAGSPTRSRSQRRSAMPSPRRSPNRRA